MRIKILLLEVDMFYFRFCKEHKLREQKQQWDLIKHPLFPNFLLNLKISTYIDINKLINILYFSHKNCVITCRICKSTEQRKNQVPLHSVFQTPCHLINGEISALLIYLSTNIYYLPYFSDYKTPPPNLGGKWGCVLQLKCSLTGLLGGKGSGGEGFFPPIFLL